MKVRAAIRESRGLPSPRDRRLLSVAITILGLVGALAVTTIQSQPAPAIVMTVVDTLGMQDLSSQALVATLAGAAALLLLFKTGFSAMLTRRVFIFLANRQARVSAELATSLLGQPLTYQQQRSTQEAAYALIQGAGAATLAVLGQTVILATEMAVLVVLGVALVFVDPLITAVAILVFLLTALTLQGFTGTWASRLGREGAQIDIASLNVMQDALSTFREIVVLNRRQHFVGRFQDLRWQAARMTADRTFLLQIPKCIFEIALVVGGGLIAGVLFLTQDSISAIGTLALFLAAASRVMPSLLRMQNASPTLRDNAAAAQISYDQAADLRALGPGNPGCRQLPNAKADNIHVDWRTPGIEIVDLSFRYPSNSSLAVENVTLSAPPGSSLAVVGRSGAGKSTLADLVLGVLTPTSGEVRIGGIEPGRLTSLRPGLVGYVPQEVALVRGTVRENVALGLEGSAKDDSSIWSALDRAHLASFVRDSPRGLDTVIGERGMTLSGGQRQRLGIAHALLSEPRFLVMDEATSALDAETERVTTEAIRSLHGDVTVLVIAHRLSTIRDSDQVAYLEAGRLVAVGAFDEIAASVPALARQSTIMGLR